MLNKSCGAIPHLNATHRRWGRLHDLSSLVKDGLLSIKEAAKRADLTETAFKEKMAEM